MKEKQKSFEPMRRVKSATSSFDEDTAKQSIDAYNEGVDAYNKRGVDDPLARLMVEAVLFSGGFENFVYEE